jgi:CBS domain containing-hemolysin-like protein
MSMAPNAWSWTIAIVAVLCATLFATADGALLAFHASEASAASDAAFAERERRHRGLSMARIIAHIAAGAAAAQAIDLSSHSFLGRVLVMAIVAVIVCVVAEGVGRSIGYTNPNVTHGPLFALTGVGVTLLRPAIAVGGAIDHALHVVFPFDVRDEQHEASAEQFSEVVAAEAEISSAEEELIHGVFSLGETEVQEIMVPRVDIVGVDAATPWSEMLDRVRSSEHARFPVYRDTLDEVVGILYAKDILSAVVADEEPADGWLPLARPPVFIPTSKRIDTQLREFQAGRRHIAIVSDEYGGTAGLITIEDILEEIVGEIRDEYDVEEPEIQQEGSRCFWFAGKVAVDELAERLDTNFGITDVATVGGLVYGLFGRVPRSGESIVREGIRIVAERVRRRRIERVYFERVSSAPHHKEDK